MNILISSWGFAARLNDAVGQAGQPGELSDGESLALRKMWCGLGLVLNSFGALTTKSRMVRSENAQKGLTKLNYKWRFIWKI